MQSTSHALEQLAAVRALFRQVCAQDERLLVSGQVVELDPDDEDELPDDEEPLEDDEDPEDDDPELEALQVDDWRARTAAASVGHPVAMQRVACLLAYLLALATYLTYAVDKRSRANAVHVTCARAARSREGTVQTGLRARREAAGVWAGGRRRAS